MSGAQSRISGRRKCVGGLNEVLRREIGEASNMTAVLTDVLLFVCLAAWMTGFVIAVASLVL